LNKLPKKSLQTPKKKGQKRCLKKGIKKEKDSKAARHGGGGDNKKQSREIKSTQQ